MDKAFLEGELTRLTSLVDQKRDELSQFIGAKTFCQFILDKLNETEAGDEPASKSESDDA